MLRRVRNQTKRFETQENEIFFMCFWLIIFFPFLVMKRIAKVVVIIPRKQKLKGCPLWMIVNNDHIFVNFFFFFFAFSFHINNFYTNTSRLIVFVYFLFLRYVSLYYFVSSIKQNKPRSLTPKSTTSPYSCQIIMCQ